MSKEPENEGASGERSFADFVREAPHASESMGTVTLTGVVLRSDNPDKFILATHGGQTMELPIEAVQRHTVIDDTGRHPTVQLEIGAQHLGSAQAGSQAMRKSVIADPPITIKETWKDPLADQTLKEVHKDPIQDTIKETHKDPIYDTIKETHKDPIMDPVTQAGSDVPGTLAETVFDPGSLVTNPATAAGGGGTPFVMATPHHAPQAAVTMQNLAATMAARKNPATEGIQTLKEVNLDTLKEQIHDTLKEQIHDTIKEMIHDTIKEQVYDTLKEVTADPTLIEAIGGGGGGTAAEGIGGLGQGGGTINPGVWNLPGLLF